MENKLFFFILVQNKRAFCQNNMFKEERQCMIIPTSRQ